MLFGGSNGNTRRKRRRKYRCVGERSGLKANLPSVRGECFIRSQGNCSYDGRANIVGRIRSSISSENIHSAIHYCVQADLLPRTSAKRLRPSISSPSSRFSAGILLEEILGKCPLLSSVFFFPRRRAFSPSPSCNKYSKTKQKRENRANLARPLDSAFYEMR